ncbi:MAG: hypothetical protein WKG00_25100 [Polyangiaceae bacterium]
MSVLRTMGWPVLLLLALAGCGGESELGEECGAEGEDGECVDGGVCGQTKGDEADVLECLVVCEEQADCKADEECNGVNGTNVKGCRGVDG